MTPTVKPPRQRADGLCVVCLKRRQPPAKKGTNRSALDAWRRDAFCSTDCAKRFYGVEIRESDEHFAAGTEFDRVFEAAS